MNSTPAQQASQKKGITLMGLIAISALMFWALTWTQAFGFVLLFIVGPLWIWSFLQLLEVFSRKQDVRPENSYTRKNLFKLSIRLFVAVIAFLLFIGLLVFLPL